jgi:hypothetical protein
VVKTQFHVGRLTLVYTPRNWNVPTTDQIQYCLREVLDIRERSEFEFLIPYIDNKPYHVMPNTTQAPTTRYDSLGTLFVIVQNKLTAPDTCANNVDILFEVSGGPDFELADPRQISGMQPFTTDAMLTAQIGDDEGAPCEAIKDLCIGGGSIPTDSTAFAEASMGERIVSLYQLIKRQMPCIYPNVSGYRLNYTAFSVRSFTCNWTHETDTTNIPYPPNFPCGDYMTLFNACFMYSRGSVRFAAFNIAPANERWYATTSIDGSSTVPGADTAGYTDSVGAWTALNNWQNGLGIEASIPQYTQCTSRLNRLNCTGHAEPFDLYSPRNRAILGTSATSNKCLMRAAGDDYALGFFIGTPPLATYNIV